MDLKLTYQRLNNFCLDFYSFLSHIVFSRDHKTQDTSGSCYLATLNVNGLKMLAENKRPGLSS